MFQHYALSSYAFTSALLNEAVSQDAIDFVHGLLVKDPAARLDAKDALSHRLPWQNIVSGMACRMSRVMLDMPQCRVSRLTSYGLTSYQHMTLPSYF